MKGDFFMNKKHINIVGIISGVLSIIFSFVVKGMPIGLYEFSETYGGDAYTGIQNAAAQTAVNVYYLADIVRTGLFAFLLVFGIALICFFLSRMDIDVKLVVKKADEGKKKETPVAPKIAPKATTAAAPTATPTAAPTATPVAPATAPDDTVTVVEEEVPEAVEHK